MSDQLVRVSIRPFGQRDGSLIIREIAVDPASTLRDLLARLALDDQYPRVVSWTFQIGDRSLDLSERIGTLCQAHQGTSYRDGILWLDLFYTDSAPGAFAGGGPVQSVPAAPRPSGPAARSESTVHRHVTPARAARNRAEDDHEDDAPRARRRSVSADEDEEAPTKRKEKRQTERRATVRYYTRMNPDRMFPLLVILSAKQIAEVVKAKVKQAMSESFQVEDGSVVEIEPVLPGCDCYPPRHTLAVESKDAITETFWIVPRVLGRVHGARVLVRQGDRVLAEIPLDVKVAKQTLAVACGLLSLAAPYLTMGLKSLKLDYDSQKADGFPLYQQVGNWIAVNLRPEWLGLGFLGLALLLYLWMRPRRRDVFWDVSLR